MGCIYQLTCFSKQVDGHRNGMYSMYEDTNDTFNNISKVRVVIKAVAVTLSPTSMTPSPPTENFVQLKKCIDGLGVKMQKIQVAKMQTNIFFLGGGGTQPRSTPVLFSTSLQFSTS